MLNNPSWWQYDRNDDDGGSDNREWQVTFVMVYVVPITAPKTLHGSLHLFLRNIVLLLSLFYKQQNSGIEGVLPRTNGKYCKWKTQPYTSAKKAEMKTAKHTNVIKEILSDIAGRGVN